MQVIERFLRWYFDVSVSAETFGGDWGVRGNLTWGPAAAGTAVAVLLLLLLTVWLYLRESRHLSRCARLMLLGLRCATILCLVVMLLQVRLVMVHYGRPLLALLLDTSASMTLGDEYPREAKQRMATLSSVDGRPRLELIRALLLADDAAFLKSLEARYEFEIYSFDEDATLLHSPPVSGQSRPGQGAGSADPAAVLADVVANGSRTNLARSVQQVFKSHRGAPPVGLIVITDGNPTDAKQGRLSAVAQRARELGSPLYVVGVGSEQGTVDLKIEDVDFDSIAFAGSPFNVDVTVSGQPSSQPRIRVSVRAKGDATELDARSVELPRGGGQAGVSLRIPHVTEGRNDFEIQLEPVSGESDLSNNTRTIRVWGRASRLNVLLIEDAPRWEYRHLKTVLERDENVSLHTFLIQSDLAHAVEDRTALRRLPATSEELAGYDAIIIGDVSWSGLDPEFVEQLSPFVRQAGGGILWIAGSNHLRLDDAPPSLAALFPIEASADAPDDSGRPIPVRLRPTVEGRGHELLAPLPVAAGQANWSALPVVHAFPRTDQPKDGALVLLEGVAVEDGGRGVPLLTAMRYGAGQVLMQSFDETWRWRPLFDGRLYRQYWSQSVRFLSRRRVLDQLPPLELVTDREEFTTDEPVRLRLLVNRPTEIPPLLPRILVTTAGESRELVLTASAQAPHIYETVLTDLPPGRYSAMLGEPLFVESLPAVDWEVRSVDRERRYQGMNREDLQLAATRSGGRFYNLWELEQLLDDLPVSTRTARRQLTEIPLWNRWEAFCLVAALLIGEWVVRRRRGLV